MGHPLKAATLAALLLTGACARTPDVTVGYYLPKSSLGLRAVRTVACDTKGNLYSATAVIAATGYSRDENYGRQEISFRDLDGSFSNSDMTLTFYDDGRLKGVNATTTGQGQEILKSAIEIATMALPMLAPMFAPGEADPRAPQLEACQRVQQFGKEGMLSFAYAAGEDFRPGGEPFKPMKLEDGQPGYVGEIDAALQGLCVEIGEAKADPAAASYRSAGRRGDAIRLKLRQPARVPVTVTERNRDLCRPGLSAEQLGGQVKPIFAGSALVPQLGTPFELPIPRGAMFGKQAFAVALGESGTISSIQYGKETGATGMLGVVNAGLTAVQPDGAAARAAELQGEADLIFQQQRLIRCRRDPVNCA